jgi:hypothetical protein
MAKALAMPPSIRVFDRVVKAVYPVLTLLFVAAPAFAQDAPPPFEEGTDVDYGEEGRAVELGDDVYSDQAYDEDADEQGGEEQAWDGPTPTIDRYRAELSPHGTWISTPEYGLVWVPAGRASWWRPYSHGEWVYTRHGWTFVSYDPWGAIPFHYGRWVYRAGWGGWAWIPGYEWSPAWVSWRYGGGYVAWAPLGPTGISVSYYSSPSLWIAVDGPHFRRPLSHRHFIPTRRVSVVFNNTREYRTLRHGPEVRYVSGVSRTPVRRVKVVKHARVVPQTQVKRVVVRRDEPEVRVERRESKKVVRVKKGGNERRHRRH